MLRGAIVPFVLCVLMQSMAQKQKTRRKSVCDLAPMAHERAVCCLLSLISGTLMHSSSLSCSSSPSSPLCSCSPSLSSFPFVSSSPSVSSSPLSSSSSFEACQGWHQLAMFQVAAETTPRATVSSPPSLLYPLHCKVSVCVCVQHATPRHQGTAGFWSQPKQCWRTSSPPASLRACCSTPR